MVNRAGGSTRKLRDGAKGLNHGREEFVASVLSRMSTDATVDISDRLDFDIAGAGGRERVVNILAEESGAETIDFESKTRTMWKFLVRCYVTLTSI